MFRCKLNAVQRLKFRLHPAIQCLHSGRWAVQSPHRTVLDIEHRPHIRYTAPSLVLEHRRCMCVPTQAPNQQTFLPFSAVFNRQTSSNWNTIRRPSFLGMGTGGGGGGRNSLSIYFFANCLYILNHGHVRRQCKVDWSSNSWQIKSWQFWLTINFYCQDNLDNGPSKTRVSSFSTYTSLLRKDFIYNSFAIIHIALHTILLHSHSPNSFAFIHIYHHSFAFIRIHPALVSWLCMSFLLMVQHVIPSKIQVCHAVDSTGYSIITCLFLSVHSTFHSFLIFRFVCITNSFVCQPERCQQISHPDSETVHAVMRAAVMSLDSTWTGLLACLLAWLLAWLYRVSACLHLHQRKRVQNGLPE